MRERQRELEQLKREQEQVFQSLGDSIGAWATGSRDAIQSVIGDLIQLIAVQALGGSSTGTGSFFGGFGAGFGGAFADGGTFSGGKPILVGEKGPELIVPTTSGTVIPNDKLGMGGGVNINSTLVVQGSVTGADDLEETLRRRDRELANEIKNFMVKQKGFAGVL